MLNLLELNIPEYFDPSEKEDLEYYLDHEIDAYFAVEEGDLLIGAGGYNFTEQKDTVCISWDFIHPEHQGKGIGGKLLEYRLAEIKKIPSANTVIVRTSQKTHGFYAKFGFELKEVKKDYWSDGFDLYYMEKKLKKG